MKLSLEAVTIVCGSLLIVSTSHRVSAAPALGLADASNEGVQLKARGGCLGKSSHGQEEAAPRYNHQRSRDERRRREREADDYYGDGDIPVSGRSPVHYQAGQPHLSTPREGVRDGEIVHLYNGVAAEVRHGTHGGGGRRRQGDARRQQRQQQQQQQQQQEQQQQQQQQQRDRGHERADSYTVDPNEYSNVAPTDYTGTWNY